MSVVETEFPVSLRKTKATRLSKKEDGDKKKLGMGYSIHYCSLLVNVGYEEV